MEQGRVLPSMFFLQFRNPRSQHTVGSRPAKQSAPHNRHLPADLVALVSPPKTRPDRARACPIGGRARIRGLPMKSKKLLKAGASALALASLFLATGASAHPIYRPHAPGIAPINPNLPLPHVGPSGLYHAKGTKSGTWTDVANIPFANGPWNARMQTDGTVLVLDYCTSPAQWYKLTPDKKGKYEDGKWRTIALMNYSPLFFS